MGPARVSALAVLALAAAAVIWLTARPEPARVVAHEGVAVEEDAPALPVVEGSAGGEEPSGSGPGAPTREQVRAALDAAISEHLPDRRLSSEQLDQLADAVLRLREAQQAIRELPRTPENAEALATLRDEIADAAGDFEYVLDLDPAAFTALIETPGGFDVDPDDERERE